MLAGLDGAAGEADHLVVLDHGFALGDGAGGDLVAGGDALDGDDALGGDLRAFEKVGAADDDVVFGAQPDGEAGGGSACHNLNPVFADAAVSCAAALALQGWATLKQKTGGFSNAALL